MSSRETPSRSLRRTIASRLGIVLLPLLIVASLLWSTSGAGSRLSQAEAAIVNLDQGATVAGQTVRLGQDYALALRDEGGSNFTWRYGVSLEEANAGLASGRFGAAVVIPPAFSRTLTGTAKDAEQATLQVERSPVSGVSDQLVTSQFATAATRSLSGAVTRRYLDEVFVSTSELGQSLGHTTTLAQAASTGATEVRDAALTADKASGDVNQHADAVATAQAGVGASAGKAAASSRDAAQKDDAATQAAAERAAAQDAQARAVADAAARAKAVADGAGKAKDSTSTVAGKATDAATQGDATKASADAVAAAAATSKAAAADYAQRVAGVAKAQQDIAGQLAAASQQVKAYTDTTATVTQAVADVRKVVAAQAQPASPAVPLPLPTAPAGGDETPTPASPTTPAATAGAVKQLQDQAAALEQVARTIDAVVTANADAKPGDPAAVIAAQGAADANATQAAAVLAAATSSKDSTQKVVDAAQKANDEATQAATEAKAAATAAQKAVDEATAAEAAAKATSDSLAGAQTAVDSQTGRITITYPDATTPTCEDGLPPGQCKKYAEAYAAGYKAGTKAVEAQVSIVGQDKAHDALVAAQSSARQAVVAAQATTAAATTTKASADRAADHASAAATAATDARKAADDAATSLATVVERATAVRDGADAVKAAVAQVAGGTAADVEGLKGTAESLRTIAGQLTALADQLEKAGTTPAPGTDESAAVTALKTQIAQALDAPEVARAVEALPEQGRALTAQAEKATAQAEKNAQAMSAVDPARGGAKELAAGAQGVTTTAAAQAAVVEQLQGTLDQLGTGMDALGTAIGSLGTQSTQLSGTTAAASDRATALAGQVGQLTGTLKELQAAATGAAADAATTEQQAVALQQQVSALQQSGGVLARATAEVVGRSGDQVDSTDAVVNALEANAGTLPAYDQTTRERLISAASSPITTVDQSTFRNVGWVSMLMLLALWAGAMGLHSLIAPISRRAVTSTDSAPRLLAREMLPAAAVAAVQALAVAVIGQVVLHLPAGRIAAVTGALVLSSLMFAAVNHTLVVFGRLWGRLLSVLFAIVTGSCLVTQAYPGVLTAVRTLSPVSPALDLVRSLMTGVSLGAGPALLFAFWLCAGCLFSALGILRAREPEPVRVPTVHEKDA